MATDGKRCPPSLIPPTMTSESILLVSGDDVTSGLTVGTAGEGPF